jgi:two-component system KDP operon response regulator KdpE
MPLVLAVDDDTAILGLIEIALKADGFRMLVASSAEEAQRLLADHEPEVILLDIVMPRTNGLEFLGRLRDKSDVPVILLTAKDTEGDKVRGLNLGADDYVVKPFNPDELSARIRAVIRRRINPAGERVVRAGDLEINLDRRIVSRNGEAVLVSGTEWKLLHQLALHAGRVVASSDLLGKVWGSEYRKDLQYLRIWISRLRSKIEADHANPVIIKTARGAGYKLESTDHV